MIGELNNIRIVQKIVVALIIVQLFGCKYPAIYRKYLVNSCDMCSERSSKLYTINETDTFYYNPAYYGRFYHNGILVFERENKILYKKNVEDGKFHGVSMWYYPSGNVEKEGTFLDGKLQGSCIYYIDSSETFIYKIKFFNEGDSIKEIIF